MSEAPVTLRARARSRSLSPAAFRVLALLALASLFLIVLSGTAVRLTGSGLGCATWPRCSEGSLFPERDFHAVVEFTNRAVSIPVGFLALATAGGAWFVRGLPRRVAWTALVLLAVVLTEAWLGGVTIRSELDALVVLTHFLLALLAVALAVVVALSAHSLARPRAADPFPTSLRRLALALVPVGFALVVTGTLVTAAGPHSGGEAVERIGNLEDAMYVHVRTAAVFGAGYVLLAAGLLRRRTAFRFEGALALGVLAALLAQMAVGETQWRTQLPWPLVLVHVLLATAVWAGIVALAVRLWQRTGTKKRPLVTHSRALSRYRGA
ncbi:MAG: COX15/CtaA family protein [Actinomycetota bacterium]|nr:COX15/CtaA family protein [Actinomycetota bacterium]